MLIKYVYVVFMGLLLACFIGFGVAAFYHGPKSPDYPTSLKLVAPDASQSATQRLDQEVYDNKFKQYQDMENTYSKNVSIIAIASSILMLVLSLTLFKSILIIADGLLLGGVFTLGYGIVRGFGADDDIFKFLAVSMGLLITLVLGYIKFVRLSKK
jgi:hypothetical protein